MNLKSLENSITRHFFDIRTWFCIVLNMYNKKKKLRARAQPFVFSVSPTRKCHFSRRIPYMYDWDKREFTHLVRISVRCL
ncbi:hypothetical protein TSAR_005479 [Trichomalopsis sarcophagae]|uniref:Uncharacterized protein n=1 Tax=Trichomalopsis sarcophagae TaxID=543379 RepID=A0A232FE90_9HYME|nr:hypothetical protein TSAR_005479 [Trichomalopsis sarcophagae]